MFLARRVKILPATEASIFRLYLSHGYSQKTMIYLFIPVALLSGLYAWKTIALRRVFSSCAKQYGFRTGKMIDLYRYAAIKARKEGFKLKPEYYATIELPQKLNRLAGDDISAIHQKPVGLSRIRPNYLNPADT